MIIQDCQCKSNLLVQNLSVLNLTLSQNSHYLANTTSSLIIFNLKNQKRHELPLPLPLHSLTFFHNTAYLLYQNETLSLLNISDSKPLLTLSNILRVYTNEKLQLELFILSTTLKRRTPQGELQDLGPLPYPLTNADDLSIISEYNGEMDIILYILHADHLWVFNIPPPPPDTPPTHPACETLLLTAFKGAIKLIKVKDECCLINQNLKVIRVEDVRRGRWEGQFDLFRGEVDFGEEVFGGQRVKYLEQYDIVAVYSAEKQMFYDVGMVEGECTRVRRFRIGREIEEWRYGLNNGVGLFLFNEGKNVYSIKMGEKVVKKYEVPRFREKEMEKEKEREMEREKEKEKQKQKQILKQKEKEKQGQEQVQQQQQKEEEKQKRRKKEEQILEQKQKQKQIQNQKQQQQQQIKQKSKVQTKDEQKQQPKEQPKEQPKDSKESKESKDSKQSKKEFNTSKESKQQKQKKQPAAEPNKSKVIKVLQRQSKTIKPSTEPFTYNFPTPITNSFYKPPSTTPTPPPAPTQPQTKQEQKSLPNNPNPTPSPPPPSPSPLPPQTNPPSSKQQKLPSNPNFNKKKTDADTIRKNLEEEKLRKHQESLLETRYQQIKSGVGFKSQDIEFWPQEGGEGKGGWTKKTAKQSFEQLFMGGKKEVKQQKTEPQKSVPAVVVENPVAATTPVVAPTIAPATVTADDTTRTATIATPPVVTPPPVIAPTPVIVPTPVLITTPVIVPTPVIAPIPITTPTPVVAPTPVTFVTPATPPPPPPTPLPQPTSPTKLSLKSHPALLSFSQSLKQRLINTTKTFKQSIQSQSKRLQQTLKSTPITFKQTIQAQLFQQTKTQLTSYITTDLHQKLQKYFHQIFIKINETYEMGHRFAKGERVKGKEKVERVMVELVDRKVEGLEALLAGMKEFLEGKEKGKGGKEVKELDFRGFEGRVEKLELGFRSLMRQYEEVTHGRAKVEAVLEEKLGELNGLFEEMRKEEEEKRGKKEEKGRKRSGSSMGREKEGKGEAKKFFVLRRKD